MGEIEPAPESSNELLLFRYDNMNWVHEGQVHDIYKLCAERNRMSQFVRRRGMERRTCEPEELKKLRENGLVSRYSPSASLITVVELVEYLDRNNIFVADDLRRAAQDLVSPCLRLAAQEDRNGSSVLGPETFFTSSSIVSAVVQNLCLRLKLKTFESKVRQLILNELKGRRRDEAIDGLAYSRLGESPPEWCVAWQILWLCANAKFMDDLKAELLGKPPKRDGLSDASNNFAAKLDYAKQRLTWLQNKKKLEYLRPTSSKIEFGRVFALANKISMKTSDST